MSNAEAQADTRQIVVDEVFPHAPETIWKTLTTGALIKSGTGHARGYVWDRLGPALPKFAGMPTG
jgi:uncharacterized protein YndB with AHSA1/START domain